MQVDRMPVDTPIGPVEVTLTGAHGAVVNSESITVNRIPGRMWVTLERLHGPMGRLPAGSWRTTGGHVHRTDRGGWGDPTDKMRAAAYGTALAVVERVATVEVRRAAQVVALRRDAESKRQRADALIKDAAALDEEALAQERGADAIEAGAPF